MFLRRGGWACVALHQEPSEVRHCIQKSRCCKASHLRKNVEKLQLKCATSDQCMHAASVTPVIVSSLGRFTGILHRIVSHGHPTRGRKSAERRESGLMASRPYECVTIRSPRVTLHRVSLTSRAPPSGVKKSGKSLKSEVVFTYSLLKYKVHTVIRTNFYWETNKWVSFSSGT